MQWPQLLEYLQNNSRRRRASSGPSRRSRPAPTSSPSAAACRPTCTAAASTLAAVHRRHRVVPAAQRARRRGAMQPHARTRSCSALAIGGYGLFGFVYSVTLRLVPRRKVQRIVEVRQVDGLIARLRRAHRRRLHLRRLPVRDRRALGRLPAPRRVLLLPPGGRRHADRAGAPRAARARLGRPAAARAHRQGRGVQALLGLLPGDQRAGVLGGRGADEHLPGELPPRARPQARRAENRATEAITEIYCERESLEAFLAEVRELRARDQRQHHLRHACA